MTLIIIIIIIIVINAFIAENLFTVVKKRFHIN